MEGKSIDIELFNPKDQPFGELSNNAKTFINIGGGREGGGRWPTVTNYIYSMLLTNPLYQRLLQDAPARNVQKDFKQYYKRTLDDVTATALNSSLDVKFKNSPKLTELLIGTGDLPIHYMSKDNILGVGVDNTGKNMLGRYLMQLRHRIISIEANKSAEANSAVQDNRVYTAYMAMQALKFALYNKYTDSYGRTVEKDYNLVKYKDLTPSEVIETIGVHNLPPIDKNSIIGMYRRGALSRGIDYSIANLDSNALIAAVRKDELRQFRMSQIVALRVAILDVYADSILQSDYPDLPSSEYTKAKQQQFDTIGFNELSELRKELFELYEEGRFDENMQEMMDEAISNIKVPTEEEVELAEATLNHPEISSPTTESPPAMNILDDSAEPKQFEGEPAYKSQKPAKPKTKKHLDREALVSKLKVYESALENESLDKKDREESSRRADAIKRAIDRLDGIDDEDVLANIATLQAQQETYLKASLSKALDSKTREHSRKQVEEIQKSIDARYRNLDSFTLTKERDKLLKLSRDLQDKLKAARSTHDTKTVDELQNKINTVEESIRKIQEDIRHGDTVTDTDKQTKIKEELKAKRKEEREGKQKTDIASSLPDLYKSNIYNLTLQAESAISIKIYAYPQKNAPSPYEEFSPLAYTGMLNIDGRTYPTVMHYIMVSRLAALPSIKNIKNGYPYICNSSEKCKAHLKYQGSNIPSHWVDVVYSENPKDFKMIDVVTNEYNKVKDENYEVELKKNAIIALDKKFESRRLQDLLLLTGSANLIWADSNDKILGTGKNKDGCNFIGAYLMKLREKFLGTRDKDDIHLLTENDIAELLIDDEFLKGWLKMRIRDMCRVINVIRTYLYLKYNISPPITSDLVKSVMDDIYQPCSSIYGLSSSVTIEVPDYFKRIIMACPGFSQENVSSQNGNGNGNGDDNDDDENLDDFISDLEEALDESASENTSTSADVRGKTKSGIDSVVDLIWTRLAVLIHLILKNIDRPTLMNTKSIISKATMLLAVKVNCIKVVPDNNINCIVSAILNIIRGLYEFNKKMNYSVLITKQDVEAAASIILDRDLMDEVEPFVADESFVDDDGNDILNNNPTADLIHLTSQDKTGRDMAAITKILRNEFDTDIVDPDEIASLILGAVSAIQTFPSSDNVKQGRINFFATLR